MLAFALALAGCGASSTGSRDDRAVGRAVFARTCSGCHTLSRRDRGAEGGDLAEAKMSVDDLASFVRVMPVRLNPAQVLAVARYVHEIQQGAHRR